MTTGLPLNPLTDFIQVDSKTGALSTTCNSVMGLHTIKVVGSLPNKF
jgi:hypothetical protein